MVHISKNAERRQMGLDEYIAFVQDHVDVYDFDSITESSWALAALANDRNFLLTMYHHELKHCLESDSINRFSPQSIRLYSESKFYIRSNIWPSTKRNLGIEEETLYSYEIPHNHNFHFSSVGYFGPGYVTELFRCPDGGPTGYIGEKVDLTDNRIEKLEPGTTITYESFRDIHIQKIPDEISISINLMCRNPHLKDSPQYLFDVEDGSVSGSVGTSLGNRMFIIEMLGAVHDDNSIDILANLAAKHSCFRTQALALRVLRGVRPDESERLLPSVSKAVRELSVLPIAVGDEMKQCGLTRQERVSQELQERDAA